MSVYHVCCCFGLFLERDDAERFFFCASGEAPAPQLLVSLPNIFIII